jgi:hypothetical protein
LSLPGKNGNKKPVYVYVVDRPIKACSRMLHRFYAAIKMPIGSVFRFAEKYSFTLKVELFDIYACDGVDSITFNVVPR